MENVVFIDYWRTLWHKGEGLEENDLDPDEGNRRLCGVCTLPIFSTPYHTCEDDDNDDDGNPHFRHKCCSKQQLPEVLTDHSFHPPPLYLHKEQHHGIIICYICREECNKGFFYQCPHQFCRFAVDVKCCTTIKVVHRSHRHELTFIRGRHDSLSCGGCGMQHQGLFYGCDFCRFYLHQDCALLPNIILHKNHEDMQHPLALVFTLPLYSLKFQRCETCSICKEKLSSIKAGVYVCLRCDDFAIHVKCAAISTESPNFATVSIRNIANGLPHFPMKNEHTSLMSYLLDHQSKSGTIEEEKELKIHDHELVLYEKDEPSQLSHLCDACIEPISAPFYTCPQCIDFFLHRCCANLPLSFRHHSHYLGSRLANHCKDKPLMQLISRLPRIDFYSGRYCNGCWRYNNGFFYECRECDHKLCVRCAILPNAITYELHGKSHILFLSYSKDYRSISFQCPCCSFFLESLYYECSSCPNFKIHANCVLQPTSVSHKYDRHQLKLIPSKGSAAPKDDNDGNFCEICEESMGGDENWFYHCKECATSFHIDCIPSVAEYSCRIKMGRSIGVHCHDCPLTSIQMLTNYSYTCSLCQRTIEGKVKYYDRIAFECSKCSFWLCQSCADKQLNKRR